MTFGYVNFPGVVGSSVTTPDHPSLDVTNDLEIRVLAYLDSASTYDILLTKGDVEGEFSASFEFSRASASALQFRWRNSSTTLTTATSGAGIVLLNAWRWYRVTVEYSIFIQSTNVRFWYSDDPPDTDSASVVWIDHSDTSFDLSNPDFQQSSWGMTIGFADPDVDWMIARVAYVELRDAPAELGGVVVADLDFRDADQITTPNTVFTDTTGKVWTIHSPAMWVADESADPSNGVRKPPR